MSNSAHISSEARINTGRFCAQGLQIKRFDAVKLQIDPQLLSSAKLMICSILIEMNSHF